MKYLLSAVIFFLFTASTCHNATVKTTSKNCYKARLAIKGICMNYVIQVLDGDLKKLNIEKTWKDESDGKEYTNVFALSSRCTFPDIAEGSEFYFTVTDAVNANCNVCMAYRPVPAAKNNIIVSQTPCR